MAKEEIEYLPSGLITCLINDKEVRILKISPKEFTIRLCEEIEKINKLKVSFYIFNEFRYEELEINDYRVINTWKNDFYVTYSFNIKDSNYMRYVRYVFREYSNYVRLKAYGEDNEFSKEMVGYPAEEDYEFYKDYLEQKSQWMSEIKNENNSDCCNKFQLAINIDNNNLYYNFLDKDFKEFKIEYFKNNYLENHYLSSCDISRVYIGNEFCHNLFPKIDLLFNLINKAKEEGLYITLSFTYLREYLIDNTNTIINKVYEWCRNNKEKIEIVINDWGMLKLLEGKEDYLIPILGVLLNKRKKDPRYLYKKGYEENKELIGENSLNSSLYRKFLKDNNIERYEYENCGYKLSIAEGNHSIHIPFYVTNTSQYCPLYAKCTTMDRGKQKLVKECPKYCNEYIFNYPKHLKMVGRYNSIFAFDDSLLKDNLYLDYYLDNGIDRIVLNFM